MFVKLCLNYESFVNNIDEKTAGCFKKYNSDIFTRLIVNELKYSSEDFDDAVNRINGLQNTEKNQVIAWFREFEKWSAFKVKERGDIEFRRYIKKLLKEVEY